MKLKKGIRSLLVFSLLVSLLVPSFAFADTESTTAKIPVTVNVAGETPEGTIFRVTLTANDKSNPMPTEDTLEAKADGSEEDVPHKGSFGPITYTKPGDYYYTVTQEQGTDEDITYDDTTYTVMVRVENQEDASGNYIGIKASVSAWKGSEEDIPATEDKSDIIFDNDYTDNSSEDTTEPNPTPTPNKRTKKTKSVKTGDNSNIYFWTILAVIAAAACVMLLLADQKRRKTKK